MNLGISESVNGKHPPLGWRVRREYGGFHLDMVTTAHAGLEAGWGTYLNVDHRGAMSAIGDLLRYAPVD